MGMVGRVGPHLGSQYWGEEKALARLGDHLPALVSEGRGRGRRRGRHRQDLSDVLGLGLALALTGDWWPGAGWRVDRTVGTGQRVAGGWRGLKTLPSWRSLGLHLLLLFAHSGLKHRALTLQSSDISTRTAHLKCAVQHVHQLGVLGGRAEAGRSLGWQLALTDQTCHGGDES